MSRQKYIDAIKKYGDNFTPSEFALREGASMTDLDFSFFLEILKFRKWAGLPMLVTSAYRPGDDGAHGEGLAIDFIMFTSWKQTICPPMRQWLLATTWPFTGIGIYFDWYYYDNGKKLPAVGIHGDRRLDKDRPRRWLRIEGKYNGTFQGLYYYQSVKNGKFYNRKTQRSIQLGTVIKKIWET